MAPVYAGMPIQVLSSCSAYSSAASGIQTRLETQAVWLIWALSGRRFGLETITVRPVQPWPSLPSNRPSGPFAVYPQVPVAAALPLLGSGYTDARAVATLDGPIQSIGTVKVDGVVLDPTAYQVYDRQHLVRLDGNVWPWHQRLTDPDTVAGTFAITYTRGEVLPESGQIAAGILVCELAKALAADPTCQLPERVQKVSREGIDVEFLDPQDFVKDGRTGIPEVDQWLHGVNPGKVPQPAQVWSPDLPRNYRVG